MESHILGGPTAPAAVNTIDLEGQVPGIHISTLLFFYKGVELCHTLLLNKIYKESSRTLRFVVERSS